MNGSLHWGTHGAIAFAAAAVVGIIFMILFGQRTIVDAFFVAVGAGVGVAAGRAFVSE